MRKPKSGAHRRAAVADRETGDGGLQARSRLDGMRSPAGQKTRRRNSAQGGSKSQSKIKGDRH